MSHGENAERKSNNHKEFGSRRLFGWHPRGSFSKKLTHHKERHDNKKEAEMGKIELERGQEPHEALMNTLKEVKGLLESYQNDPSKKSTDASTSTFNLVSDLREESDILSKSVMSLRIKLFISNEQLTPEMHYNLAKIVDALVDINEVLKSIIG